MEVVILGFLVGRGRIDKGWYGDVRVERKEGGRGSGLYMRRFRVMFL